MAPTTMEDYLRGKKIEELSTVFPPVWVIAEDRKDAKEQEGEWFSGAFVKSEMIQPTGVREEFMSYTFAFLAGNASFVRSKEKYVPCEGEIVSVSGEVLGRALADIKQGDKIVIRFKGLGEKKGKRSAPKLYEVKKIS